jgi:hypothetical protein
VIPEDTRCTNFEGAKGLKLGFTNLELARNRTEIIDMRKSPNVAHELQRRTLLVSKPDALRNRTHDRIARSVRDFAHRARHGDTEPTPFQLWPCRVTDRRNRKADHRAFVPCDPPQAATSGTALGHAPLPLCRRSPRINPGRPQRLPTDCQQMTFVL